MRHGLGSAAALLLTLVLGSCSDADGEAGDPATPSSEATDTATPTPPDPTETWTVPAAGGPRLELNDVTLRAPRSYRVDGESVTGTFHSAAERGLGGFIGAHQKPAIDSDLNLRQRAKVAARNRKFTTDTPPRLARFVTVNGVRMYHLTGPADENDYYDEYGAVVDGEHIYVTFTQPTKYPPKKRERVIESVLASLTWN